MVKDIEAGRLRVGVVLGFDSTPSLRSNQGLEKAFPGHPFRLAGEVYVFGGGSFVSDRPFSVHVGLVVVTVSGSFMFLGCSALPDLAVSRQHQCCAGGCTKMAHVCDEMVMEKKRSRVGGSMELGKTFQEDCVARAIVKRNLTSSFSGHLIYPSLLNPPLHLPIYLFTSSKI